MGEVRSKNAEGRGRRSLPVFDGGAAAGLIDSGLEDEGAFVVFHGVQELAGLFGGHGSGGLRGGRVRGLFVGFLS